MPIIKQASKKLRHDRKRTKQTMTVRRALYDVVKTVRKTPSKKSLSLAFQALDKAAKRSIIHKNKAARLKSRLSKLLKK
jgi:small subunit ribosomal protein S20